MGGRLSTALWESATLRACVWGDFFPLGIQGRLLGGLNGIIIRDVWLQGQLQSPNIEGDMGGRLFAATATRGGRPAVRVSGKRHKVETWGDFFQPRFLGATPVHSGRALLDNTIAQRAAPVAPY